LGATGFGVVHAIEAALPEMKFELSGARVAVQGFGAVGLHAARFLAEKGAVLVAASDSRGAVLNDRGLDVAALIAAKRGGAPVAEFDGGTPVAKEAVIGVECEIWIPSARPDVIDMNNVEQMNTKLVAQGANIPITQKAEQRLHEKGVLILPDFIANAGGVICAAMEYRGAGEKAAFDAIAQKIRRNVEELLTRAKNGGVTPRRAAVDMAQDRVRAAMKTRRWSIY
jgi:glutamate dehydrogenase (NAD(P)+)